MKDHFKERSTREYYQKPLFSKEELERRESLCVYEDLPYCSAACPLNLDVKEFLYAAEKGNFKNARSKLEYICPFPEILAYGCQAPCQNVCRRKEVDETVQISAVERAVMKYGEQGKRKGLLTFKKKKSVAVFGTELFTLALLGELDTKNYPLDFYTEKSDLSSVIETCIPTLPDDVKQRQLQRLEAFDMNVHFQQAIDPSLMEEKRNDYDIICGASYLIKGSIDPVTLCDDKNIVYSSQPFDREYDDVLQAFYDARRAGVSIDRIAQGLHPSNNRGVEGAVETHLYTNLDDIKHRDPVPENGLFTKEQCQQEAARCIQCECVECFKGCAYLRAINKNPRILTREIYNNTGIIMGDHMMNKAMNSCALCGQCTITCPNGYDMGEICRLARVNMVETQKMSLAVHEFALLDMIFSNSEAFLSRKQPGLDAVKYVYFPGCQAGAIAPNTVKATYSDLMNRVEGGVGLLLGCCGVIAKWAGREELYQEQIELLKKEMSDLGDPIIVAGCPTCQQTLQEHFDSVIGLWDLLDEIGLPQRNSESKETVTIHDACATRNDKSTQDKIRKMVRSMGKEIKEREWSKEKTRCCGYGGLVSYVNKEVAMDLANDCISEDLDLISITYCMACRDRLVRAGSKAQHITELIYETPADETPDISQKRANRLRLKETLLKEIWKEETIEPMLDFTYTISDDVKKTMDERMILESDLIQVLQNYHDTQQAIYDKENDTLTTTYRIGNVSFWVRFKEQENHYEVESAYSHRMTVKER